MTVRRAHDGSSFGPSPTPVFSRIEVCCSKRLNRSLQKYLENLKLGTENRLSELRDGMAGRTVTGVTDRHRLLKEIESLTNLHDGPSQARRAVTGCVIPVGVGFLVKF